MIPDETTAPRPVSEPQPIVNLYPPSWVDRLMARIQRLPIPSWLFYLALVLTQILYINVILWSRGKQPVGTISIGPAAWVVFSGYFLILMQYLNRVASTTLEAFRPALDVSEAEYLQFGYQLTTLPARGTAIATLVGVVFSLLSWLFVPPQVIEVYGGSVYSNFLLFELPVLVNYVITISFIYHTIHQLRMVDHIHNAARQPDIYDSDPLYAFSALTARTGIGYLLIAYFEIAAFLNLMSMIP